MTTDSENRPEEAPEENVESFAEAQQAATQPAEGTPEFYLATIKALQAEADSAKDKMMRALADAENTRRRAVKDREDAAKYAVQSFARDMLTFSDNFHRAMGAIPPELATDEKVAGVIAGLDAMDRDLLQTFEKHGIKKIEPLDEPFNPNFHEVMFEAPVPGKPGGIVIQVVEAGYVLNDRLLRAAKVGISKGGPGTDHQIDQSA